jgi:putative tryptophan/tyrosine transport system substrate-binding protein
MRRREFITFLGSAAATPLAARAQQRERVRRIGMLMNLASNDPESQARNAGFLQTLGGLGWIVGRNITIEYRWTTGDLEQIRKSAAELVALAPDVIVAVGALNVAPLRQLTRTIPIVFTRVTDPVGNGFVESMERPGGNATGFALFEFGISPKWLELLKEIAPNVTRAAVVRDSALMASVAQMAAIQSVAPSFRVELRAVDTRDDADIERGIAAFAREPNGGLIVVTGSTAIVRRDTIVAAAAKYRLPAVYPSRVFVATGGLASYGPDTIDSFRLAAGYVNRILKGEKPSDLPVQSPTKYELVINLKTAKALDLDVPATVLARADEVIE